MLKKFKNSLLHFVYPPRCLHCEEMSNYENPLFCSNCVALLQLIDPKERCPSCFEICASPHKRCSKCFAEGSFSLFHGMAAAFEYIGPAATLVKKLKYGNQPGLAKGAGAFLVAQLVNLGWPLPDVLVPVPLSLMHWIDRGYNQSELLAKEMSKFLEIPVRNVLKRESGDYSQAALTLAERKQLQGNKFYFKKGYQLEDKRVLLIDDVMTSGSTLRKCGEVIVQGHPNSIYALSFCRAMD